MIRSTRCCPSSRIARSSGASTAHSTICRPQGGHDRHPHDPARLGIAGRSCGQSRFLDLGLPSDRRLTKVRSTCRFHKASFVLQLERGFSSGRNRPEALPQTTEKIAMRFMMIVKATKDSEAGVMPSEKLMSDMQKYHEELQKAGVLLDASGLKPSSKGWRVKYSGAKRTVIDGPFAEAKEPVAGYTIIHVKSREEAMEWARRFPNPAIDGKEADIEIRQLFQLEAFALGA